MAISFNPGQTNAPSGADSTGGFSSGAPTTAPANQTPVDKYIPTAIPTIAPTEGPKDTSPFVFLNREHSSFALYFQLAIIAVFLITVSVTVGMFMYMGILSAQLDGKRQELAQLQGTFPKLDLNEMATLAKRIKISNTVLSEQASIRTALRILEESVSNQVTYNKFTIGKNKTKKGYNLSFAGETIGYENLYQQLEALQSKIFSSYFTKPQISGIGPLDKKGIGTFRIDTAIAIEGIYPDSFTLKEKEEYLKSLLPKEEVNQSTESNTNGATAPVVPIVPPTTQ